MAEDPTAVAAPPAATPAEPTAAPAIDWEKRYKDAEVKISEQGAELSKFRATPAPPAADPNALSLTNAAAAEPTDLNGIMVRAGVSAEQIQQEWQTNSGQLTAESYAKFAAQGYPRPAVDQTVRAYQAEAQANGILIAKAHDDSARLVGGEQQLQNLITWGAANTTPAEQETLNKQLATHEGMIGAVATLHMKHQHATGAADTQPLAEGAGAAPTQAGGMSGDEFGQFIRDRLHGKKFDEATIKRAGQTPLEVVHGRV